MIYIESYLVNGAYLAFLCYLSVTRSLGEEQMDGWFGRDGHLLDHSNTILLLEAGKYFWCANFF